MTSWPWCNPEAGQTDEIPRFAEIADLLARRICRELSTPEVGRQGH
jgi:hypothetical protein